MIKQVFKYSSDGQIDAEDENFCLWVTEENCPSWCDCECQLPGENASQSERDLARIGMMIQRQRVAVFDTTIIIQFWQYMGDVARYIIQLIGLRGHFKYW